MRALILSLRRLRRDQNGATLVEFALVAPMLIGLLLICFDLGHRALVTAVLEGAVQEAARAGTLQDGADSAESIDIAVYDRVAKLLPDDMIVTFERLSYRNFTEVGQAEEFIEPEGEEDGICNNGERFIDTNRNGEWDEDRGQTGSGSARDKVSYRVSATWAPIFPRPRISFYKPPEIAQITLNDDGTIDPKDYARLSEEQRQQLYQDGSVILVEDPGRVDQWLNGSSGVETVVASTVLVNQPFGEQDDTPFEELTCDDD